MIGAVSDWLGHFGLELWDLCSICSLSSKVMDVNGVGKEEAIVIPRWKCFGHKSMGLRLLVRA